MPILLYVSSNLPIPEGFVSKVNREVFRFIWSGKPEKINRVTLMSAIENGGLKMTHFEHMFKAQKVMWGKRLLSCESAGWKAFPLGCLSILGTDWFKCSPDPIHLPVDLPLFYHQVLYAWAEYKVLAQQKGIEYTHWDVRREVFFF